MSSAQRAFWIVALGLGGCSVAAGAETPPRGACTGMVREDEEACSTPGLPRVDLLELPADVFGGDACGDGLCVAPESCSACSRDCGGCVGAIELYFTRPTADAERARDDAWVGLLEATLLGDLATAEHTIDVAIYSLNRAPIVHALGEAAARGVRVRVLTECENRFGPEAWVASELEQSGVLLRDDRSSFAGSVEGCPDASEGSMHHKFLVVDHRTVWVGSTNLTWTGLSYNDNAMLRLESAPLAEVFLLEHAFLWERDGRLPVHRSTIARVPVGGTPVEVGFSAASPAGPMASRQLVTEALASAEEEIAFAAFSLTDEAVSRELVAQADRAAGVIDATASGQSSSRLSELCAGGVPVVVENRPGKVHHKLMAIDPGTEDGSLLIGSANFTRSGFDTNDDVMVRVFDAALALEAALELDALVEAPENQGRLCAGGSAESPTASSPRCGDRACVCQDGLDNDHDGRTDDLDGDCRASPGVGGAPGDDP